MSSLLSSDCCLHCISFSLFSSVSFISVPEIPIEGLTSGRRNVLHTRRRLRINIKAQDEMQPLQSSYAARSCHTFFLATDAFHRCSYGLVALLTCSPLTIIQSLVFACGGGLFDGIASDLTKLRMYGSTT